MGLLEITRFLNGSNQNLWTHEIYYENVLRVISDAEVCMRQEYESPTSLIP